MASLKKLSYNNILATLTQVAESWRSNNPTYVSRITSISQLESKAMALQQERQLSATKVSAKLTNTNDLARINADIQTMSNALRHLIKANKLKTDNVNNLLAQYGFVSHVPKPRNKNISEPDALTVKKIAQPYFIIPKDNDQRAETLDNIIRKLSEPNNAIGIYPNILQNWIDIKNAHAQAWADSKNIKSSRALPIIASQALKKEVILLLNRLYREIKNNFDAVGRDVNTVCRSFGFLAEIQ